MNVPIDWLLEGEAYVRFATLVNLLDRPVDDAEVRGARRSLLEDGRIIRIVADLQDWPAGAIASHRSASQPFHKLAFLADVGLCAEDPGMAAICERVLAIRSDEGPFSLRIAISAAHGGSGEETTAWALCDAPIVLYALVQLGLAEDPARSPLVMDAGRHLMGLVRENGWPCAVSSALGNWRGPGRKDDPCPFATLAMLKVAATVPEWRDSDAARAGAESLLDLWSASRTRHPYMFYMGTDFRKLKAPFVWYDLLHVLDVLTRLGWPRGDPRLSDMLELLASKADSEGRFTPESVYKAWADWDFGRKTAPSRWLTLLAHRTLRRA